VNHGSLFSGIGGFDLAAEWAGYENIFHCEWNPFGQRVLKHYWPNAISYDDITKTDFTIHRGKIDLLSGGFPCQDASNANQSGSRKSGFSGSRTGLAFEMLRAYEEINPLFGGVSENVPDLLKINSGKDFRIIISELARMGYNSEWRICRASEVGAAHQRARLFMVAYSSRFRLQEGESFFKYVFKEASQKRRNITGTAASVGSSWINEPKISFVDDGLSSRLDRITFPKWRNESIKGGGNAIVPQVAYQIFKAINQFNDQNYGH
jgi:DNA (cytosine-5)-methyltransferase 1